MLQLQFIRENTPLVKERLSVKNFDGSAIIDAVITADDKRREIQKNLDNINAESNTVAKEIGNLFKAGKVTEANELKEKSGSLKIRAKELETAMNEAINELDELLLKIPNLPHSSVNPGRSAEDNVIVHEEGALPQLHDGAVAHWDLATTFDIIDFGLGNKITGAGFPVYKGKGARLQRALINFFLEQAIEAGYAEIQPPFMVNSASGYGTGQLPDKDGQMYYAARRRPIPDPYC